MNSGRDGITFADMGKLLILRQGDGEFVIACVDGCQEFGVGAVKEDIANSQEEAVDIFNGCRQDQE